jgi:hypothetical protein
MAIAKERALWQKTKIILVKSYAWQNAPEKTPISGNSIQGLIEQMRQKDREAMVATSQAPEMFTSIMVKTSTVEEKGEIQS